MDEIFYDVPFDSEAVIQLVDNFPEEFLEKVATILVNQISFLTKNPFNSQCRELLTGNRPNTYTFAKSLAENVIRQENSFPIAVVRPSIGKLFLSSLKSHKMQHF